MKIFDDEERYVHDVIVFGQEFQIRKLAREYEVLFARDDAVTILTAGTTQKWREQSFVVLEWQDSVPPASFLDVLKVDARVTFFIDYRAPSLGEEP